MREVKLDEVDSKGGGGHGATPWLGFRGFKGFRRFRGWWYRLGHACGVRVQRVLRVLRLDSPSG